MSTPKEEAQRALQELRDDASWDDVMYDFYVRQKIGKSIAAFEAGEVISHEEIEMRYLPE
jgi:hypothetical protein